MNDVGAMLRKLREERGLGLRELARALDLPPATLSHREIGRRAIPLDALEAWGNALGVRLTVIAQPMGQGGAARVEYTPEQQALLSAVLDGLGQLSDREARMLRVMLENVGR